MKFMAIYDLNELWQFNIKDNGIKALGLALLIAVVAIAIVFAILYIIVLSVQVLKLIGKDKQGAQTQASENHNLSIKDIKDDDMMVAALVATIDFNSETKKDARLVSIKEIK